MHSSEKDSNAPMLTRITAVNRKTTCGLSIVALMLSPVRSSSVEKHKKTKENIHHHHRNTVDPKDNQNNQRDPAQGARRSGGCTRTERPLRSLRKQQDDRD